MRKINFLIIIFFILVSCSGLKEAGKVLRNEKLTTTDEFLVKKKEPLILPPDYTKLPTPGTLIENKLDEEEKIKKILKAPREINKNQSKNSSIESSIIEKIRK
ncbi:DUF3035 domain-containing protein [Pelagibacteraceae bacterium]|jgi:hypothetical protein|nr:DUF3035 domain-containing protein [Pelagibacteraceae bacterium]